MSNITIKEINYSFFMNSNIYPFADIIYQNFIELSFDPKLKHNKEELLRLLKSPQMGGFIVFDGTKVIGYLIGELITLADGRYVYFINYIYTGPKYRSQGVGSKLMNLATGFASGKRCDNVVLICDTEDHKVFDFYAKRGFMLDIVLRRYEQHDVLSVQI